MKTIIGLLVTLYTSHLLALGDGIPNLTCGDMAQNAVVEVYRPDGLVKVFMTSGGYTEIFDLYQTNNPKIYCDDQDTRLCFKNIKPKRGKSKLFFVKDRVRIEVAEVKCTRNV